MAREQLSTFVTTFVTEGDKAVARKIRNLEGGANLERKVSVDIETSKADRGIEELRSRMNSLLERGTKVVEVEANADDAVAQMEEFGGKAAKNVGAVLAVATASYTLGRAIRNQVLPPIDAVERRLGVVTRQFRAFRDRANAEAGAITRRGERVKADIEFQAEIKGIETVDQAKAKLEQLEVTAQKLRIDAVVQAQVGDELEKSARTQGQAALITLAKEFDRERGLFGGITETLRGKIADALGEGGQFITEQGIFDALTEAVQEGDVARYRTVVELLKEIPQVKLNPVSEKALNDLAEAGDRVKDFREDDGNLALEGNLQQVKSQIEELKKLAGTLPEQTAKEVQQEADRLAKEAERAAEKIAKAQEDAAKKVADSFKTPTDVIADQIKALDEVIDSGRSDLLTDEQKKNAVAVAEASLSDRRAAIEEQLRGPRATSQTVGVDSLTGNIQTAVLNREKKMSELLKEQLQIEKKALEETTKGLKAVKEAVLKPPAIVAG